MEKGGDLTPNDSTLRPADTSGDQQNALSPKRGQIVFEINGVRESTRKPVKVRVEAASLPDAVRKAADNGVSVDPATATVVTAAAASAAGRAETGGSPVIEARPRVATVSIIAVCAALAGGLLVGLPLMLFRQPAISALHAERVVTPNTVISAPGSTNRNASNEATERGKVARAEQERHVERQREATTGYWSALAVQLNKLHSLPSGKAAEGRALLKISAELGAISSLDVDPQALQLGMQWTKGLRRIGDIEVYMAGDQWLLDCMRHGANGDPLWAIEEKKRLETEVGELFGTVQDASISVRQALTQRYGVEFAHIP